METEKKNKNQQSENDKQSKKGRVIVRNLVYDINEKHLQKLFTKFGTIQEIVLPKNPATGKAKGYGFIQFENKNNALKAIKELNGSKFKGRSIVLDLAIAKDQYENKKQGNQKYGEKPRKSSAHSQQQEEENQDQDLQKQQQQDKNLLEEPEIEVVQTEQKNSQKQNQKQQQKQQEQEKDDDEISMASYSESSDFEVNPEQQDKMEDLEEEEDEDQEEQEENLDSEEEDLDNEDDEEEEEKILNDEDEVQKQIDNATATFDDKRDLNRKKQMETKEDLSNTVFVRNISFNTNQTDFEDFFKQFGEIYFAKLVVNHITGDNKGTGFVKFKDAKIAQKLIQATSDYDSGEFSLTETPLDLDLNGRRLICLESLKRDDADKKSKQYEKDSKNKIDIKKVKNLEQVVSIDRQNKRRLKLARLGTFDPNLAKNEIETDRRKKHLEEKLEKLKNPNNVVSVTRVAFKHLPKKAFDEIEIKQLISHFLEGLLTVPEIKKQKIIRQVSLLRNPEKANQSRGIAFVEFAEQKYAEHFLREIQKNIDAFRKKCQNTLPIVEYAIEDIRKIRKIEQLRQKREQAQKDLKDMQNYEEKKEFKAEQEKLQQKTQNAKKDFTKTPKEKPINQKQLNRQQKKQEELAAKLQLKDFLNKKSLNKEEESRAQELINAVKSRGAKQRLKQQLNQKFNLELEKNAQNENNNNKNQSVNQTILTKSQMKKEKLQQKKELMQKKNQTEEELKQFQIQKQLKNKQQNKNEENQSELKKQRKQQEKALVDKVQAQIKNKRKAKQQINEEDDLDLQIQQHLQKKQKQLKWDQ